MENKGKWKEKKLIFYVQPLDADTNRCISEMLATVGKSYEKHFSTKKEVDGSLLPTWECEYENASAIIKSQKTLNLKFNIWLPSSDGRFLDRRGEFLFKNLKKRVVEKEVKKEIFLKKKSAN